MNNKSIFILWELDDIDHLFIIFMGTCQSNCVKYKEIQTFLYNIYGNLSK